MGVDVDFLRPRPLKEGAGVWAAGAAGPAGEGAWRRGQAGGGAPPPPPPRPRPGLAVRLEVAGVQGRCCVNGVCVWSGLGRRLEMGEAAPHLAPQLPEGPRVRSSSFVDD